MLDRKTGTNTAPTKGLPIEGCPGWGPTSKWLVQQNMSSVAPKHITISLGAPEVMKIPEGDP